MTPEQRAAAERLADDMDTPISVWADQVAHLLRELAAEPMQEPAIWIQSNHLQHAKNGPYLARTGPTKLMSDFIPLYAAPQRREPLSDAQIEDCIDIANWQFNGGRLGPGVPQQMTTYDDWKYWLARAVERAHGIVEAP